MTLDRDARGRARLRVYVVGVLQGIVVGSELMAGYHGSEAFVGLRFGVKGTSSSELCKKI